METEDDWELCLRTEGESDPPLEKNDEDDGCCCCCVNACGLATEAEGLWEGNWCSWETEPPEELADSDEFES